MVPGLVKAQTTTPPITPPIGPCKFGAVQSRMPIWGNQGLFQVNSTVAVVFTAETDFDWVRLIYFNMDTATHSIASASVAASSMLNDLVRPTDATGTPNPALWAPATFNGAGAFQNIPPTAGSTRTVTIPAAVQNSGTGNSKNPGIVASDWINIQSLARLDAGATLPLLFVRTFSGSSDTLPTTAMNSNGALTTWDAYANGRIIRSSYLTGDAATTPSAAGTFGTTNSIGPHAVQFLSRKRGLNVLVFGDSLVQGYGTTTTENDPWQAAACALSTPSFPVCVLKAAYQGMNSFSFNEIGLTLMAGTQPDVVFIKSDSPNDGVGTAALYEASISRGFAAADQAIRQNAVPVLMTAQPWGYTGSAEAARLAFNAAIRASGYLVFDMDAILSNGASPAVIQPQYNSGVSPPHYNDAGTAAMAPYVQAILQQIIAVRPVQAH